MFVEPLAVVELGNRLAEAAAEAREEAERILRELSVDVAARAEALRALVERGRASSTSRSRAVALSRGWHGAEVQVADEVRLVGARHPLLDRATAVPIDLDLGDLRALVISGPNTGGKTVALKTLGLAALLHQCGLRPPAAEATLPVFDEVLADIGDRQSIEMSLSTFSGHVRTLVAILASATERSLVLLDEVAAGTDPEEGSALAQALVERLAGQARLTVVTTHYAGAEGVGERARRRRERRHRLRHRGGHAAVPARARPARDVACTSHLGAARARPRGRRRRSLARRAGAAARGRARRRGGVG